jgi:tRNA dimethylallyltransferase
MTKDAPVVVVAGPTASGKSALAMALAMEFDGVVINADSMQIYRELRILTARPGPDDEARVPHRLYGILPVQSVCSAARWRDLALVELDAARRAGRLAVICGGTGLYLRALMRGLSPIPEIADDIRIAVRARLERDGAAALHDALAAVDPVTAARLAPRDRQRIARAWEVYDATGRPLSQWQALPESGPPPGTRIATIILRPPRAALYAACDARMRQMVAAGALVEIEALAGIDPDLPAMKALGIADFRRHLAGGITLEEAILLAQQATRRYAKRQMTWFKNQIIADYEVFTQYSEKLSPEIFSFIRQKLLTIDK